MADVLKANLDSWRQTSLWDDLAALFLLRPEIFGKRGGHFEPALQQHPDIKARVGFDDQVVGNVGGGGLRTVRMPSV